MALCLPHPVTPLGLLHFEQCLRSDRYRVGQNISHHSTVDQQKNIFFHNDDDDDDDDDDSSLSQNFRRQIFVPRCIRNAYPKSASFAGNLSSRTSWSEDSEHSRKSAL